MKKRSIPGQISVDYDQGNPQSYRGVVVKIGLMEKSFNSGDVLADYSEAKLYAQLFGSATPDESCNRYAEEHGGYRFMSGQFHKKSQGGNSTPSSPTVPYDTLTDTFPMIVIETPLEVSDSSTGANPKVKVAPTEQEKKQARLDAYNKQAERRYVDYYNTQIATGKRQRAIDDYIRRNKAGDRNARIL